MAFAPCPAALAITVAPPTAAAPTTVTATVTPALNIKAVSVGDFQSFHIHYYVDIDPQSTLVPGGVIPSGNPQIIHSGTLTQDLGALSAGTHTMWVVVGQLGYQDCGVGGNVVVGSTTFTFAAQTTATSTAVAPAAAKTGNGRLVQTSESPLPWALATFAIVLVATAGLVTRQRAAQRTRR